MLVRLGVYAQSYNHLGIVDAAKVREAAVKATPMMVLPASTDFSESAINTINQLYVLDEDQACIYVFDELLFLREVIKTIETTTGKVELRSPKHLCIDRFNNLYVYDSKLGKIIKKPVKGDALLIGQAGWGVGELGDVKDIAVDSKGLCYVLNRSRNVVDVYSPDGIYLTWITGTKPFHDPMGIGMNGADELYVLDSQGPTVYVFNDAGNLVNTNTDLATRKNVLLKDPVSMAVLYNGDFLVMDEKLCVVYHFNRVSDLLGTIGSKGESREGVFVHSKHLSSAPGTSNRMAILDDKAGRVHYYEVQHLKPLKEEPSRRVKMIESTTLRKPVFDLAVGSNGLRYVIPAGDRSRVIAYKDTSQLDEFTISGIIDEAAAIACDTLGNLYVADRGVDEVLVFNGTGSLVRRIGKEIAEKLKNPTSLVVQSNGSLVVADEGRGSLLQWNLQGQFVKVITSADNSVMRSPVRIDCDSKDQLYVWDDDLNAVLRIGSGGWPTAEKQLHVRSEKPGGPPGTIGDFYVDPLDQIHVYNKTNHQIEVYTWEFEPVLIYSIGYPGKSKGAIGNVDQVMLDTRTLNIYLTMDDGEAQKVYHYLVPPPMPSNTMLFDVVDNKLIANFSRVKSKAVVAYGLTRPTAVGDSVVYRTEGNSFTITQSSTDHQLYHYDFVALSWSDHSDPSMGFDDYFHYAEAMVDAHKYQEAIGSWMLALETMGKQSGMVEHIARRLGEVSTKLLQEQNIDMAIDYVKAAFRLSPKSEFIKSRYRDAVMAHYSHLVNQREINTVISDMQVNISNTTLRTIYLQTADTLARVLALQDNLNSINDAIKVQKKMMEWDANPLYSEALGISFFELYKFKSIRQTSTLELRSVLEEALTNSREAYRLQKGAGKPYFLAHLIQLAAMNELGKYKEVETQATAELGSASAVMSKEVIIAYRMQLAKSFSLQDNHTGAEGEYTNMLSLMPGNREASELLIEELIALQKYDAASDILHQLMLGKEENANYTFTLGRISLYKSNGGEAVFQLEKALSQDPALRNAYGFLADAYALSTNNLQAIKNYVLAIQYTDEQLAKTGQGNRNKQEAAALPQERLRYLKAAAKIYAELQNHKEALAMNLRLIKLQDTDAMAQFGAGQASVHLGRIYNAVEHFQRAVALDPTNSSYAAALKAAEKQRSDLIASSKPLSIADVMVNEIFPSIYKNYSDVHQLPAGEIVLTNTTESAISPSSLTVFCPEVMSSPTQVQCQGINAKSNSIVRFPALFNEAILENTEARMLQMEAVLTYMHNGQEQVVRKSGSFMLNNRNAIVWSDKRRMASFIAPATDLLVDYNKQAEQVFKGMPKYGLSRTILKAGQLYTVLNRAGLAYSSDPNQGYANLSLRTELKDFLQFPLETFVRKGGDCDDLVALYGALLESGGVSAAYIDVPGHVMVAFDCGVKSSQMAEYGLTAGEVIVMSDRVWIPIEATKIGTTGFFSAWKAASERYYRELEAGHFPELIPFSEAWNIYKPSTYQPKGLVLEVPNDERVKEEYRQFVVQFVSKTKQSSIDELKARCVAEPENVFVRNALGTLLTQTGQYEEAKKVFLETLEMTPESAIVINNLGNVAFLQGKYSEAMKYYEQALQLDETDAQIHINICKTYLQQGEKVKARSSFDAAIKLDPALAELYNELNKQF
ncbi:MAG: tetratricopeptide repeat protein [Flavobacteriales bacterium]